MKILKNELNKILNFYFKKNKNKKFSYPLLDNAFSKEDIFKGIEVLLKKKTYYGRNYKKI